MARAGAQKGFCHTRNGVRRRLRNLVGLTVVEDDGGITGHDLDLKREISK